MQREIEIHFFPQKLFRAKFQHISHYYLFMYLSKSITEALKGQLISKCLFSVFKLFQKTNENKSTWGIIVVKSNFFVRFLEELRTPESPFEINWPLTDTIFIFHIGSMFNQRSRSELPQIDKLYVYWRLDSGPGRWAKWTSPKNCSKNFATDWNFSQELAFGIHANHG